MKKKLIALAGMLTLATGTAAQADTFSPTSATAGFGGTVTVVQNSVVATCDMSLTIQTAASGTAAVATGGGFLPGDFLCAMFSISTLWVDMATAGSGHITNTSLTLTGVPPTCGPSNVPFGWSSGPQQISFSSAPVGTCASLNGILTKNSGPTLTMNP